MRNDSTTSSIDPSQHKKSTSSTTRSHTTGGLMQNSTFSGIFKRTITTLPDTEQKI